jgi:hypothetical protein
MTNKKLPLSNFIAELNYLEFYQSKTRSAEGTYRVIEEDDTINYCVIAHAPFRESWYSDTEYQDWTVTGHRVMDVFDRDLEEDLMDSWDIAMIAEEGRRRADEIPFEDHDLEGERWNQMVADQANGDNHAMDDAQSVCADVAADKTLADYLREAMAKEPVTEVDVPTAVEELQSFMSEGYRDYTLDHSLHAVKASGVGVNCDTSGLKTVFKDGMVVHEESMETIRERIKHNDDLTDVEFNQMVNDGYKSNEEASKAFDVSMTAAKG